MHRRYVVVSFILLLAGVTVNAGETIVWPSLENIDSVSGRAATKSDVQAGRAVFLLQSESDESAGTPLDIEIPQYAYHVDEETGERTAVVIIQAEELADKHVVGALDVISGQFIAALLREFELLGSDAPE